MLVYSLCALTSLACGVLLLRRYAATRTRLLLWSGLCFMFLFLNNLLVVIDTELHHDWTVARSLPAVVGVAILLYGLIWDSRR
ncbi:MAG: DUF5985 family protein [Gemmatimonadaceae bacterium]